MNHILIATEANEGMGHIAPWGGFVEQALAQGHQMHMAAPHVGLLHTCIGRRYPVTLWPSPGLQAAAPPKPGGERPTPKSWPELLVSLGYAQPLQLEGLVRVWCNLLQRIAPAVIVADYAPALMLAAHLLRIPIIEVGSGYCVPPLAPALQSFPGVRRDAARLAQADAALCAAFNPCLAQSGQASISTLSEMQDWPAHRVVCSPPELDHYGQRTGLTYAGLLREPAPELPSEQPHSVPSVVGYLKASTPGLNALISQLSQARINALIYVAGLSGNAPQTQGSVTITHQPLDLAQTLGLAQAYLSNGGLHGVGLALQKGCWPLVVPQQAEQAAMARNLVQRGWGGLWLPSVSLAKGHTHDAVRQLQIAITQHSRQDRLQGVQTTKNAQSAEDILLGLATAAMRTPTLADSEPDP